jgi:ADP-ribosylglycohydrolase
MEISLRDRIRGCLLGGAVGDALGAGIEFSSWEKIRRDHGPDGVTGFVPAYGRIGAITDDTQMTIFTVEGILRGYARSDYGVFSFPLALWFAYQRWLRTQDVENVPHPMGSWQSWLLDEPVLHARRAPGHTSLDGLRRTTMHEPLPAGCASSKGCGSVIRSAPFGLWGVPYGSPSDSAEFARKCSALTHGHPTAGFASAALAWMVREMVDGVPLADAVGKALGYLDGAGPDAAETATALHRAVRAADDGLPGPEQVAAHGSGWIAEEALAIAVLCALGAPDVRRALLAAVNHGGDSDSTGSICGQLLGTALGDGALPPEWVIDVEARGILLLLADDLWYELTAGPQLHSNMEPGTRWKERYPGY